MNSYTTVLPVYLLIVLLSVNYGVSAVVPSTTVATGISSKSTYQLVPMSEIDAKITNMTTFTQKFFEIDLKASLKNCTHGDVFGIADDLVELGQDFIHNHARGFYIDVNHYIANWLSPSPAASRIYNKVIVATLDKVNRKYADLLAQGKTLKDFKY